MNNATLVTISILIFSVAIIIFPIKYASADSQWNGSATINSFFNDTSRPNIFMPVHESIEFNFTVAKNNTITGSGIDFIIPDAPGRCSTEPALFSVNGNSLQNNTVFTLSFSNFSHSKYLCPLEDNPGDNYVIEPSLPNDVIKIQALDGETFSVIQPTLDGHGRQNIALTIHENPTSTPEFGSVIQLVLVISIVSIITLSLFVKGANTKNTMKI